MQINQQISRSYKAFSSAEGSQHIASEYAIKKLQELVAKFHIQNVLEVGLGIGCIAGSLLKLNQHLQYFGTEANEFCLNALPQHLKEEYKRLQIHNELRTVPKDWKFDMVIIDGKDPDLHYVKDVLAKNAIITVEGDRMPQQELLQELFPSHKFVHSISAEKNKAYSPFPENHWQGGIKVIFLNPTSEQKIWWAKEKLFTKLKYWYRKIR